MDERLMIIQILKELHPDADITSEQKLIRDGILSSFDIVSLITDINQQFCVNIPPEEIVEENFESVDAILALIHRIGG